MQTSLEELVRSYVERTEKIGSPYCEELVRRITAALGKKGYSASSDAATLKKTVRHLIAGEQEKTAQRFLGRAVQVSPEDADDLAQHAWLNHLQPGSTAPPVDSWKIYLKQQNSPVPVPDRVARSPGYEVPRAVEVTDAVFLEALGAFEPNAEQGYDVRQAFARMPLPLKVDLKALVIEEEPLWDFARRNKISLIEARERKARAIQKLQELYVAP